MSLLFPFSFSFMLHIFFCFIVMAVSTKENGTDIFIQEKREEVFN